MTDAQGKKYALHPSTVKSRNDGDWHYVSALRLSLLYGVNPRECITWTVQASQGRNWDDYIHLYPRYDGNYVLPKETDE